jgi:hypothetical protein
MLPALLILWALQMPDFDGDGDIDQDDFGIL